jgi:hypothetical protein
MFKKIFFAIILLEFLYACTNTTPATTSTLPVISTSSYTATVIPTTRPSTTPKPSTTPDPTDVVMEVTQQAFNDLKSIFPGMCESYPWLILKSPDKNWLAQDCAYDSLQIIKSDGSITRKITYKEIFGKSTNYPYNQGEISPKHWTSNSQYLYFSVGYCCWDPGLFMLSETSTLYRLNINNGTYSLTRSGLFDYSFSPTDRRITFIEELQSPPIVEIQDLTTGSVDKVKLGVDNKHNQASVDAWSSDGLKFAVSTVSGMDYNRDVDYLDKFSLIIIDVKDLSQKIIIKDMQTNYLRVLGWSDDNILTFQTGYQGFSEQVRNWQYDLNTDTLITPTPNP